MSEVTLQVMVCNGEVIHLQDTQLRLTSPDPIRTEVQKAIQFPLEAVWKGQALPPVQIVVLLQVTAADLPQHIAEVLTLQDLPHPVLHQVVVLLLVAEVVVLLQEGDSLKQ
jgi:hypothetical protein